MPPYMIEIPLAVVCLGLLVLLLLERNTSAHLRIYLAMTERNSTSVIHALAEHQLFPWNWPKQPQSEVHVVNHNESKAARPEVHRDS